MTEAVANTETIVVERVIKASQETIFAFWTESEKLNAWLTKESDLDPRPGGKANMTMGGHIEYGPFTGDNHFIAVDPYSHIEFTWGFDQPQVGVPPASSTVVVDLIPHDDGTLVRVTHKDLPAGRDDSPFSERKGWDIMLGHLEEAATA